MGKLSEQWARSLWSGLEIAEVGERFKSAVAKGELTEEQAKAKWKAISRQGAPGAKTQAEPSREEMEEVAKKIKAAVAAGRLSPEDARAKLEAMRKAMSQQAERRGDSPNWDTIKERIEGAVKRGDLTRAEADAKYKQIKERMAKENQR